jgi:hypothetical protein
MSLPPVEIPSGAMRFNSDSQKLEYWDGSQWVQVSTFSPNLNGGPRGLFGGGLTPSATNTIEYITISSTGNTTDFGDLTAAFWGITGCSSSTRGLFGAGVNPVATPTTILNTIEFITISSTGNSQDFGDVITAGNAKASLSSSTRGIFAGARNPTNTPGTFNNIEYVTIASQGVNAQDFGDLVSGLERGTKGCSSPTRGIFSGSYGPFTNIIAYITISTLGNTQDFGDLTITRGGIMSRSNATRGVFGGGYSPTLTNNIDYITITTLGNAIKFGELSQSRQMYIGDGNCASSTRGVFAGGYVAPTGVNTIDYVTILTTGNAVDFGDLSGNRFGIGSLSNAHGGL